METTSTRSGELNYSRKQLNILVILRMMIGWHLLYEGMVKLWNPNWSAAGYLMDSKWLFAGFFHWIAGNSTLLAIADFVNVWGLIIIGLSLILGLYARYAAIGGIVLLSLYYLSHPPVIGVKYALPSEGSYLFINKNLIEIFALAALAVFPTSKYIGLERLLALRKGVSVPDPAKTEAPEHQEKAPVA